MVKRLSHLHRNMAFNYAGQLYSTLIGIIVLPLFLREVGAEAYGLIGFYTLIQSWMTLMDIGMTPTLGREVSRLRADVNESKRLVTLVNSLEVIFCTIAALVLLSLILGNTWLTLNWLTVESLSLDVVKISLVVIAFTVAFRWISSLNRSGINAYEEQAWLNIFEIIVNTLRFPVALVLVAYFDGNVLAFFYFQLAIVICELIVLRTKFRKLMPKINAPRFLWAELKRIAPFALSVGYTAAIWVLLTQLDKLVLSTTLTLSEYGYFTLVATVSTGVMMLSGPVSKAILPRMTCLFSQNNEVAMLSLYRKSTRLVVLLVMPVVITIAAFPYGVLYAWTGSDAAANWGADILSLFILGSGLLMVTSFQHYLQYVHGNLKFHVRYNTFSLLFNAPLIILLAIEYGPLAIAWLWLCFRLVSFLFWVPYIHKKFAPSLHQIWVVFDVIVPFLICLTMVTIVSLGATYLVDLNGPDRFHILFALLFIVGTSTLCSFLLSFFCKNIRLNNVA